MTGPQGLPLPAPGSSLTIPSALHILDTQPASYNRGFCLYSLNKKRNEIDSRRKHNPPVGAMTSPGQKAGDTGPPGRDMAQSSLTHPVSSEYPCCAGCTASPGGLSQDKPSPGSQCLAGEEEGLKSSPCSTCQARQPSVGLCLPEEGRLFLIHTKAPYGPAVALPEVPALVLPSPCPKMLPIQCGPDQGTVTGAQGWCGTGQ